MSTAPIDDFSRQAELGDLLAATVAGVVRAQDQLDLHAAGLDAPALGVGPALPPLAFVVKQATVAIAMAATFSDQRLVCRLVDAHSVSLFGYEAASGTSVRLVIGPKNTEG